MKTNTSNMTMFGVGLAFLVTTAAIPIQTLGQSTLWSTYQEVAVHMLQTGHAVEAERYLGAALHEAEQAGPETPQASVTLNALGMLYSTTGRSAEAQSALQRALDIRVKVLGPEHPEVGVSLESLALLKSQTGEYEEADLLANRALQLKETALGPRHPEVGISLATLANISMAKGDYPEAETRFRQGLANFEQSLGPTHPVLIETLNNLAVLYALQGDDLRAEALFIRALALGQHTLGPRHPRIASILTNYANLLKREGRDSEAFVLERAATEMKLLEQSPQAQMPNPVVTTPSDLTRGPDTNLRAGRPSVDGDAVIR